MTATSLTTIGFIGAGHIGSQLARLAVAHGYRVVLSNSRGPETLSDLVDELGPQASAATSTQAAEQGDLVVVTIPLKNYQAVPAAPLAGKTVIDTNNYYWERDGHIAPLDDAATSVSELLQAHLPGAKVVKGVNNIRAADLTTDGAPTGTPDRRALIIAGDDADAKALVSTLFDEFGFDTFDAGPLAEGWRYERDTPAYGTRLTTATAPALLSAATRGTPAAP